MGAAALSAPRIYYLHARSGGADNLWDPHIERAKALGFTHLLLAWPFSSSSDLFLTWDVARIGTQEAASSLRSLVEACRKAGLILWIDLAITRTDAEGMLAAELPFCWVAPRRVGIDPRQDLRHNVVEANFADEPARRRLIDFWRDQLRGWCALGIDGVRCHEVQAVPADIWQDILAAGRDASPGFKALAWMQDASPGDRITMAAVFDYISASPVHAGLRRLAEDHATLDNTAALIACPEDPFAARPPANAPPNPIPTKQSAIMTAALLANGWLLPQGCEFGLEIPFLHARDEDDLAAAQSGGDLGEAIIAANVAAATLEGAGGTLRVLEDGADLAIILRTHGKTGRLVLLNRDPINSAPVDVARLAGAFGKVPADQSVDRLPPAWGAVVALEEGAPIRSATPAAPDDRADLASQRIAIEAVSPSVDGGRFAAKRSVGDLVVVTADIFSDGHEVLAADVLWRAEDETGWSRAPMAPVVNDRWQGEFPLLRTGRYLFAVEAWWSEYGTFRRDLGKKFDAGLDIALENTEGRLILEKFAAVAAPEDKAVIDAHLARMGASQAENAAILLSDALAIAMTRADPRPHATGADMHFPIEADREGAAFSSWYELFPRSITDDPARHGTFRDVIGRLPAVQAMGFDVLYFPPIHPIGKTNRKGRNNTLTPGPDDPGSPYAIGSADGGHEAIHPELGSREDFRALVREAAAHGLEIALDFAIQCAPDHPWLKDHPGWFQWRPDGSMRYAENPPKKYQDIVNVDFYAGDAIPGLWLALRDVVQGWVDEGVRIFRVDNPHTKPFPFWEWLIADIRSRDPGVLFLAEAFTRPKVMYRLGKVGFSQSYTYFTWRNTKAELTAYLSELNQAPARDVFRPHFFVNTPDINPVFLQNSGRPGFLIRAALAATLSGLWGVYSGFELCESDPVPGKEEYLDSEKYEIKPRDWQAPGNIIAEITRLNQIRRSHRALQSHLGLTFYNAFDDNILYFGKRAPGGGDIILVAVNLDPFQAHGAGIELPLWEFGLPDDASVAVEDLMTGERFAWHGKSQTIHLDPNALPFSIWRISAPAGSQ
ncbi:hypothetical protein IP69_12935 [Bosea sp. AAP35]|nr:hypothetical protein IP69_12935 [Bosea sp. AAP35]